jgi:modulator of FtsH protease
MSAYEAADWSDVFVAGAGAGAALAGLVFVAVSINVERIIRYQGLPERALATLFLLLGVVVVSLLVLAPDQSALVLGLELVGAGLAGSAFTVFLVVRPQDPAHHSAARQVGNLTVMLGGTVPFVAGGLSIIAGGGGGLYWVLGGMIVAILGAVLNAWVFLVEVLR